MTVKTISLKFKIEDKDFKNKFVSLARQLEFINMLANIKKDSDGIYIFVTSFQRKKRKWLKLVRVVEKN